MVRWCVSACFVFASCSQAHHVMQRSRPACEAMDSLYSRAFLRPPFVLTGNARFDVNQYRLRGQFVLTAGPAGTGSARADAPAEMRGAPESVAFDFVSSSYFGGHREDMTIALADGVARILDRERDTYAEGADADRCIRESLGISEDFKEIVALALGAPPDCTAMENLEMTASAGGGVSFRGRVRGEAASVSFGPPAGRLREIVWPLEIERGRRERLRISYGWSGDGTGLETVLLAIENLRWQIKLTVRDANG
jgi:hypothetical protein